MPATPGTSTLVEVDPAIGLASSDTWDPFVGIEAGRTIGVPPLAPWESEDALKTTTK